MLRSLCSRINTLKSIHYANYSTQLPSRLVAFMDNQEMIMCWHPEQPYPYEYTKPLPLEKSKETNSVLKVGEKETAEMFKAMKPEFVVEKLSEMTYTTKHIWYPKARSKRWKINEKDRPYL